MNHHSCLKNDVRIWYSHKYAIVRSSQLFSLLCLIFLSLKTLFLFPLLIKFFEENLLCSEMVPFQNVYNGKSLQLLNLGKNPIQIKWSKLHLKPNKCNRKITYQYLRLKIRKKSNNVTMQLAYVYFYEVMKNIYHFKHSSKT